MTWHTREHILQSEIMNIQQAAMTSGLTDELLMVRGRPLSRHWIFFQLVVGAEK